MSLVIDEHLTKKDVDLDNIPFVTEILSKKNMCALGGYELKRTDANPEITLIASGSEVEIAVDASDKLKNININSKVVSMPCQE